MTLNYLFSQSNTKSHGTVNKRRRIRASTAKEKLISSPSAPLGPWVHAALKIGPRTRASTVKERHRITKAKPRQGITMVKPRTRAATTQKLDSRSPPISQVSDLGVAIEGEYEI